ncbi:heavy metal-associated isoprenylated plant protein 3-like [Canna indica]|uniref:Heavy metal-associated isoprenylated plant protein 3-like n=1 Tax=Canna indica TaxID=4628 RepID=A0AAQ3KFB4_9LILI|nr:heavy metal-associated isoprenylated plant protein 3-like [Canna indica]
MGEEKEKKWDGEKNKEQGGDGEKKKEEQAVEVKLDMHCEGCAHKVRKAVKGLEGVEAVIVDPASSKLKAIGKVDPWKLKEFLEAKTKKKVDFISPKDPPKKSKDDVDKKKNKGAAAEDKDKDKKKSSDDNKPKPPVISTVALKIPLHCDGCIKRIKRNICKIKGVDEVTADPAKDLVTVKGTMDAKTLPAVLKDKLKRSVEVIPAKKDGGGEKKEKGGKEKEAGGGEMKEKEGGKEETAATTVAEATKMDYYGPPYGGYAYRIEMIHAPQIFSDENPNACAVM